MTQEMDAKNYLEAEISRLLRSCVGKDRDRAKEEAIKLLRKKLHWLMPIGITNTRINTD